MLNLAYKLKKTDILSVIIMFILLALLFAIKGIDHKPGEEKICKTCVQDIGEMKRYGHYEQMLLNGTQHIHHSGNPNILQFTKKNNLSPFGHQDKIQSCIECHNEKPSSPATALGELWVQFPKIDKKTGKLMDFENAVQREFVDRYNGTKPFYNDVRITEILVYAYEKARQKKLTYQIEPEEGVALNQQELKELNASAACLKLYNELGAPKKSKIAFFIVKGCNIFTETTKNRPKGFSFWKTNMNCTSCHLNAGSKEYAISVADAIVNYPGVYSSNNIIYTNRMRIARCYAHSINEILYGSNSAYYKLLTLHEAWLAQKMKLYIGQQRESRGVHNIRGSSARHASIMAGQKAYIKYCQACHGMAGFGTDLYDKYPNFNPPPLNGNEAFVHTATMSYPSRFASFIHNNMPIGATHEKPILTKQEALDIAEFIRVQTRPSAPGTNNLTVFYNYLANQGMKIWFGHKSKKSENNQ